MTVTTTGRPRSHRRRSADGEQVSASKSRGPTKADLQAQLDRDADRRTARQNAVGEAISLAEIPIAALAALDQARIGDESEDISAFTLDLVAIESHRPMLTEALCDLADTYPVLGGVLDKLAKATPFGALVTVAVSLGVQIAENHRALPAHMRGLNPGLVARDDLVAQLSEQAAARKADTNGAREPVA